MCVAEISYKMVVSLFIYHKTLDIVWKKYYDIKRKVSKMN